MFLRPSKIMEDQRMPAVPKAANPDEDLTHPDVTANGEKASFQYHCQFVVGNTKQPNKEHYNKTLDELELLYQDARWALPDNWITPERVDFLIESLNMKGSPGYPYCLQWTTNHEMFRGPKAVDRQAFIQQVLDRCHQLINGEEVSDPIRLFIKREPHTKLKASLLRWRLIWSISVMDQLIDAILWEESLQAEIRNYRHIPTKVGMSLFKGGWDELYKSLEGLDGRTYGAADFSSFDWTVGAWCYDLDTQSRFDLCLSDLPDNFKKLAKARDHMLQWGNVVFSDGMVVKPLKGGIQKSGSKRTISMNSKINLAIKILAALKKYGKFDWSEHRMVAMGDDSLGFMDFTFEEFNAICEELGFRLKYLETSKSLMDLDFCSHGFMKEPLTGQVVPKPLNWQKHCFNLRYKEGKIDNSDQAQSLFSLCLSYAFDAERFKLVRSLLAQIEPRRAVSERFIRNLVTGWECC